LVYWAGQFASAAPPLVLAPRCCSRKNLFPSRCSRAVTPSGGKRHHQHGDSRRELRDASRSAFQRPFPRTQDSAGDRGRRQRKDAAEDAKRRPVREKQAVHDLFSSIAGRMAGRLRKAPTAPMNLSLPKDQQCKNAIEDIRCRGEALSEQHDRDPSACRGMLTRSRPSCTGVQYTSVRSSSVLC